MKNLHVFLLYYVRSETIYRVALLLKKEENVHSQQSYYRQIDGQNNYRKDAHWLQESLLNKLRQLSSIGAEKITFKNVSDARI